MKKSWPLLPNATRIRVKQKASRYLLYPPVNVWRIARTFSWTNQPLSQRLYGFVHNIYVLNTGVKHINLP
jgi:hypothetical protein